MVLKSKASSRREASDSRVSPHGQREPATARRRLECMSILPGKGWRIAQCRVSTARPGPGSIARTIPQATQGGRAQKLPLRHVQPSGRGVEMPGVEHETETFRPFPVERPVSIGGVRLTPVSCNAGDEHCAANASQCECRPHSGHVSPAALRAPYQGIALTKSVRE